MVTLLKEQPAQITLSTPVVLRTIDREYREGYVRGYNESAARLLSICERVFAGSGMMQFVRDRFTDHLEDAATDLDKILYDKNDIFRMDIEIDPAYDIDITPSCN